MKNVADIYALSPMQQLMLFHARASQTAHDVLFNQIVYAINGPLDRDAYHQAWQSMVDRHPALRTIFIWQDGKDPVQVVREQASLPWTEYDWRELPHSERKTALNDLLARERDQGFDMMRAPLMRLSLIQTGEEDHWLVWSSHHLVVDRWCIGILLDEIKAVYEAHVGGRVAVLAPAPRYRDYIAWLSTQDQDAARAYWQETLQDLRARPLALLPGAGQHAELGTLRLSVQGDDWAKLRQFGLDVGVTSGTLIAGAWALVLGAATSSDDTLFGLTVSGRPAELAGIERTVGCFINNVPLRVTLDEKHPLTGWLKALQGQQLDLQPFEYASLAQIESWSGIRARGPLFDTLLVLQAPVQLAEPAGLAVEYAGGGMQTGYPISLGAVPDQNELRLTLNYERETVPAKLINQIADALRTALLAMPASADAHVGDVLSRLHIERPDAQAERVASSEGLGANRAYVFSRTSTEQKLAEVWAEVLGLSRVGVEDRFSELGGDSIKSLQLFTAVEQRLGVSLPISLLFKDPSIAEMAEAIGEDGSEVATDPIVVPINERGTRPPVFFTHGVQGGLIWLKNVAPLLDPEQPAYGLQAVGLQVGVEPDRTMEAMAARYAEAMRRVQPSGPYHLAGFCFGGVLAYEVARQLEEQGEETALLVIIDGFPPRVFHHKRPLYDPLRLEVIRRSAPHWIRGYQSFGGLRLRERLRLRSGPDDQSGEQITNSATPAGGSDELGELVASTNEQHRRITQINERAGDEYMPQPYGGRVTLFRAELLGIKQSLFGPVDPKRGWGTLARGGVSIRTIHGSHVGMLSPPFVHDLADQLNDALRTAAAVKE